MGTTSVVIFVIMFGTGAFSCHIMVSHKRLHDFVLHSSDHFHDSTITSFAGSRKVQHTSGKRKRARILEPRPSNFEISHTVDRWTDKKYTPADPTAKAASTRCHITL
jgi:hypothetical protein